MTIMVVRMMIFMCDNIGCLNEWVVNGGGVNGVVGVLDSFCVMLCVILCMMLSVMLCLIVCKVVKVLLRWNNDFMLFWGFDLSLTDGRTDERTFVLLESLLRLKTDALNL